LKNQMVVNPQLQLLFAETQSRVLVLEEKPQALDQSAPGSETALYLSIFHSVASPVGNCEL
jgi:hypothetical protein